mmetsp:Transcript_22382/g.16865  ORF Transcript_22382/g.16865 Transcript_22382/m.16865 type:complete len:108 (-) Transcript_22382:90-413(-)
MKVMNGLQLDWCSKMVEIDHMAFTGDQSGTIYCYDLKKNKSLSWMIDEGNTIRDLQVYKHYLLVAMEKGEGPITIFNLKTLDIDKKIPPYQHKKLENIDDILGFYSI